MEQTFLPPNTDVEFVGSNKNRKGSEGRQGMIGFYQKSVPGKYDLNINIKHYEIGECDGISKEEPYQFPPKINTNDLWKMEAEGVDFEVHYKVAWFNYAEDKKTADTEMDEDSK